MKWLVWSKNWQWYGFWDDKADGKVRSSKSYNLGPLCDVSVSRLYAKRPKIDQKHNKTRWNDWFDLKIGNGTFFRMRKPTARSEFPNFKILTPLLTQNHWSYPKQRKIDQTYNKTRLNYCFELRIGKGTFFVTKKLMALSKFKDFGTLTPFMTSLGHCWLYALCWRWARCIVR